MAQHIPLLYLIVFSVFDFLLPLLGIYLHLFMPSMVLSGFTPSPVSSIAPETRVLLDGMAGWFAGLIVMHLYVRLIRPDDLSVWRALQASLVFVDAFMLLGFARELKITGRTSTNQWRGEDWQNIVGYSALTLIRTAFALGVGVKKSTYRSKQE